LRIPFCQASSNVDATAGKWTDACLTCSLPCPSPVQQYYGYANIIPKIIVVAGPRAGLLLSNGNAGDGKGKSRGRGWGQVFSMRRTLDLRCTFGVDVMPCLPVHAVMGFGNHAGERRVPHEPSCIQRFFPSRRASMVRLAVIVVHVGRACECLHQGQSVRGSVSALVQSMGSRHATTPTTFSRSENRSEVARNAGASAPSCPPFLIRRRQTDRQTHR